MAVIWLLGRSRNCNRASSASESGMAVSSSRDRSRKDVPERRASSMRRAASSDRELSGFVGMRGYQHSGWTRLAQREARATLRNRREKFAGGDGGAFFGGDGEDAAGAVGLQLVLHLHGFHHYDALAGDDRVAGGGEDSDYFAGHGAEDGLHSVRAGAGGLAGPVARVADFDFEAVAFDGDDEAGGRVFDEGVVAAAIEEDGVDTGFGGLDVGVARWGVAELEAAGRGGGEDLDGVGAAVNGEGEFHWRGRVLPPRPGARDGAVVFPVLTHWATFFRPTGLGL